MKAVVVDTNVPLVANGKADQADADCVIACLDALDNARQGMVILDDKHLILDEYMRNLSLSGKPGAGDAFIKWLFNHQADTRVCEWVRITPKPGNPGDFEEFPDDLELIEFDRSDRKFVAVARASGRNPVILNAVDSDWWKVKEALRKHKVRVHFLCPNIIKKNR